MLILKSPYRGSAAVRSNGWLACRPAVMALLLGLAACNPVDTWRDWTGASRNDPDPETTPNTRNLAAGEAADYPNLATVPAPPVRAMTAAERDKLTQSLIADRANARYSDEQLRAGFSATSAPPPPPPGAIPASEPEGMQAASTEPAPPSGPATAATVSRPAAPPPAPQPVPRPSSVALAPGGTADKPATASAGAATRSGQAGRKTVAGPASGLRKHGEPPEPGPMESSLEVPQARAVPQPEQIEPAPPPPQLPPPKAASAAGSLPGGLAAGGALAPTPLGEAKTAAGFEPAPPAPKLPPAPTQSAAAESGKAAQKPPAAAGTPVAEIKFAADSTSLTKDDRQKLEAVIPLYQQNPGKVRVVGYAGGGNAVEKLNGYRAALDRAQAVSAALKQAGIPADKIQAEAAPAGGSSTEARAEVILEH